MLKIRVKIHVASDPTQSIVVHCPSFLKHAILLSENLSLIFQLQHYSTRLQQNNEKGNWNSDVLMGEENYIL